MQMQGKHDRILCVRDGYLQCPVCRNKRLMKINPDTEARALVVFCRKCKSENIVDIEQGQCFKSRSQ